MFFEENVKGERFTKSALLIWSKIIKNKVLNFDIVTDSLSMNDKYGSLDDFKTLKNKGGFQVNTSDHFP